MGVCKSFSAGVDHAFGAAGAEVLQAVNEFLLSMPLAIRCANRVLIVHSLPSPGRPADLPRDQYRPEDLRRGGGVYERLEALGRTFDDAMDELVTAASERDDAVYRDDCIGFFFQPDPSDLTVYQIYVNSDGVVFDQKITFDENMWWTTHTEWDGEYEIATSRADDRWTAELRIPFETLKSEPGEETVVSPDLPTHGPEGATTWRLNFRRKQQRTSGAVDWQVPIDYNPETFGEIDLL